MRICRISAAFAAIVLGGIAIWLIIAGPILLRLKYPQLRADPSLIIWNPLRNRDAEQYANKCLEKIQSGNCLQEVEQYQLKDADKKTACEKQKQRPLMTPCQLIDRHDSKSCVDIWFSCPDRFHPTKEFDEVGLGLCYRANDWVLLSYERID